MKIQLALIGLVLFSLCFSLTEADYCSPTVNGVTYDLTGANNSTGDYVALDAPTKSGSNIYYIQICQNTNINCSGSGNTNAPVCQRDTNGNLHSLGQLSTQAVAAATNTTFGPFAFQISYTGGAQGRTVMILMKCNAEIAVGNVFKQVLEPTKPNYQIFFQSQYACEGTSSSSGGSGGLIFIIVVFALLGVYFIGGMLYMKFARHAEGKEIIPNHEFWFDLPHLIKDGCMFLVNKVRGRSGYSTVE